MDQTRIPLGDLNEIKEQIEILTKSITANVTDDFGKFFTDMVIRIKSLERQVEEYKRYIPIIYSQINNSTNEFGDGIFSINIGPYTPLTQTLLMLLPKEGSIEGNNTLNFIRNSNVVASFEIYKESNTGQLVKASKGDIVPNRTVLFRLIFNQLSKPRAVIINTSGLFNENVSNLYVTNSSLFGTPPLLADGDRLISKKELEDLSRNLQSFKNKFIFTESSAIDVANDEDTPDGSIIIEIDHD